VLAVQFTRFGGPDVLHVVELPDPQPGPGEIRIRVLAAGVNASDWKKRRGLMDPQLPQTLGHEAAGIVDVVGDGVDDARVGDRVVGVSPYGAAQATRAVLSDWTAIPDGLDDVTAAALPAAVETAARALDHLELRPGQVVFVHGASGAVGSAAVQLAVERGVRVIGSGSPATHARLRALGASPVSYGPGMVERVRAAAASGVDRALDVGGHGAVDDLVELTGDRTRVVSVGDPAGARRAGVHFSTGEDGRATYALAHVVHLAAVGRFDVEIAGVHDLRDVAEVHRIGEAGRTRGKLILVHPRDR
jgi:NADPH:quinone reductase-like Zn-dependent oxidoreductase